MSYAAPTVGPTGLTINNYQDILAYYLAGIEGIFGSNIYLGNDSALFQLASLVALTAADANNGLQLAYNQESPTTAVGAGLSSVVAVNGLQRESASYSTCLVIISGIAGTPINGGVVADINGNLWNLPPSITIGSGGTVTVTATAQQTGSINITAPNQITTIAQGLTNGWTGVNNGSNVASIGQPVETDSRLRTRQALSTELPSETLGAGTIAAILAVPGVTGMNNNPALGVDGTTSFENPTNSTDDWGNPAHSITAVVVGGAVDAIAEAIYNNRGLGVLTNNSAAGGTPQSVDVTDPNSGIVTVIGFIVAGQTPIYVSMDLHVLAGGNQSVIGPLVQAAIASYLNSLQVGALISYGELVAVANSINPVGSAPIYSVRAASFFFGTTSSPSTNTDVPLAFYEVAEGEIANVVITWV